MEVTLRAVPIVRLGWQVERVVTDRIGHFKRAHLPSEAPLHHAVEVLNAVADLLLQEVRVAQHGHEVVAQVLPGFVLGGQLGADALPDGLARDRVEGFKGGLAALSVRERFEVQSHELLALATVVALAGLVADPAALEEGGHGAGGVKARHVRVLWATGLEVGGDIPHDVEAHEVVEAERRAARATQKRPGDRVDLLDGEV